MHAGKGWKLLKSRALRLSIGAVLGLLLLWVIAWLAVPPLLKWQLETRGSQLLGRELRVGQVQFSPVTLTLTLRQLSMASASGDVPQLQVERLFVDLDARSLLRLAPVIAALEIDAPRLQLARLAEGRYDIDDLLQRFAPDPAAPPSEPARFALFNLRVADGEVHLDDRPVGRTHELRKIALDLPFLSNLPDDLQVKVEPRLAFELNGAAFDNQGRSTPFAQGRASEFDIRVDALDLAPMWAYLPATLPVQPGGGRLSAVLKLHFEQPQGSEPRVQLKGQLEVRELQIKPPGDVPLLAWQSLRVQLADVRPLHRSVVLDALQLDGLVLHVRRDASGRFELERLAAAAPASSPAPVPAPAWQLQLDSLEVKGAQIHWSDAALQPAAELQLDAIDLQLKQLRWPFEADAGLSLDAQLKRQGKAQGQLHAEGSFTDRQAKLALQLADIDLALAEPYLRQILRLQTSARLQAAATLDWAQGDAPRLNVGLASLRIDDVQLTEPAARAPVLQLARLELSALQADLLQRRVAIGALGLQRPFIALSRDADGSIDASRWVVVETNTAVADSGPPWQLALREFTLDGGRLRLADAALPAGLLEVDGLKLLAQGLAWPAAAPAETQLSARLALARKAGGSAASVPSRVDWRGRISPQPLGASGQLRVERFPVHVVEPYFGASLPVQLQRLEAGFQGKVDLQQQPAGLSGQVRGDVLLADLRVLARTGANTAGAEILSWNAVAATGVGLSLQPDQKPLLEIDELRLSDYYSRLEITEDGRFNLQTVAAPNAQAPAAAASAVEVSAPSAMLSRLPISLVVNATRFDNGRVDFRDLFIRPNYSAQLTELNGTVGRLDSRSRDMATLQLSGRVAGTGLLEIGGSVNPTVIPPALDIKAKATDIELPGLTPYSSKYAGYPIERGKLSVDVAYKIEADGKLEASNQIIVNQLTFGPKSDSPDATKLPVPFIVALLQDRHGVIDLDLPLTGSVNDPQFSMGALIWKVIVNLFTKVLSSPFAAIGGGGKDLSHVDFRPGTALIADGSQEVIAKVAKALDDRPQLKLGIVAMADPVSEAEAMRRAAFEARLLDEQRRERGRAALGAAGEPAPLPPLTAEQRARLVGQIYEDTRLPDKPRNVIGMVKDIPAAEMEAMLVAAMPVDAAAGRLLAQQRGRTVREALMAKGLGSERLFIGEPKLRSDAADNTPWVPQAQLSLSVN
jgi:uncharacterized protein involved in outer membrane biogenesis